LGHVGLGAHADARQDTGEGAEYRASSHV